MSKIKKVTGYLCSDGSLIEDEERAEAYQDNLDLKKALRKCLDFYDPKGEIDVEEIAAEIAENLPTFIEGKIKVLLPEDNDE